MNVSVIVPVYNKIEIIYDCIKLNIINSGKPCRWIIIDNNSDSATQEGLSKLKTFAEEQTHTFEILRQDSNLGVAKAWNIGLKYANTDLICILNNDCIMMPGWTEKLTSFHQKSGFHFISPFVIETSIKKDYSLSEFVSGKHNWEHIWKKNMGRVRQGHFGGVAIFGKREDFLKNKGFDETYWLSLEEMDFFVQGILHRMKAAVTGDVVAVHLTSTTRKDVAGKETQNQQYFKGKWGWSFMENEQRFLNKKIRSWQRFLLRNFFLLSEWSERLPVK